MWLNLQRKISENTHTRTHAHAYTTVCILNGVGGRQSLNYRRHTPLNTHNQVQDSVKIYYIHTETHVTLNVRIIGKTF